MNNLIVVVFPDETRASEAIGELEDLHRQGVVTVYAAALVERGPNGELSVQKQRNPGGRTVGARLLTDNLVDSVQRDLPPGALAIVGDVSEDSIEPIDMRMSALGGEVTRTGPAALVAGFAEQDLAPLRTDLAEFSAEQAADNAKLLETKLDFEIRNAKDKLQRDADRERELVDRAREAIGAKLEVLRDQAARATPEARERIQERLDVLRGDLEQREAKLKEASELATEALH